MSTIQKRTLTITCADGEEVTRKQHSCFVHNLVSDIMRPKPLIIWKRNPEAEPGVRSYYTNGLAEGTLITLRSIPDNSGVEFTYSRHGKLLYTAIETQGDTRCDMHMTALLHRVAVTVGLAETTQKPNPLAETMKCIKPQETEPAQYSIKVADVFRRVTADQMIDCILRNPSMLSIGITEGSNEWNRREALIRATVSYIQHIAPKENGLLLQSFALKSIKSGRLCGHLITSPLTEIANAYVSFDEKDYGGLSSAQRNQKFARDIIVNLLIGN